LTITKEKLEEEAIDHTLWSARSGRGYGPVLRLHDYDDDDDDDDDDDVT
jgi:hypothetical protein